MAQTGEATAGQGHPSYAVVDDLDRRSGKQDGAGSRMGVTDDVRQPLPKHPAEELPMAEVDDVHRTRQIGCHPSRPEKLLSRGQLPGQGDLPVVRHRRPHVGQRAAAPDPRLH